MPFSSTLYIHSITYKGHLLLSYHAYALSLLYARKRQLLSLHQNALNASVAIPSDLSLPLSNSAHPLKEKAENIINVIANIKPILFFNSASEQFCN